MHPRMRKTSSEDLDPISLPFKALADGNRFESAFERAHPIGTQVEPIKRDSDGPQNVSGGVQKTAKVDPVEFRWNVWQENGKGAASEGTESKVDGDPCVPNLPTVNENASINTSPDSLTESPTPELKSITSIDSVGTRSSVASSSSSFVKGFRRGLLDIRILDLPTKLNKAVKRSNSLEPPLRKKQAIERPSAVKTATSPALQKLRRISQDMLPIKAILEGQIAAPNNDVAPVKTAKNSPTDTPSRRDSLMSHLVRTMSDGTIKRGSLDTQKPILRKSSTNEMESPFTITGPTIDNHEMTTAHSSYPWASPALSPGPQLGLPGFSLTPISESSRSRQDLALSTESLGKEKSKNSRETVPRTRKSSNNTSDETRSSSRQGPLDKEPSSEQTRKMRLGPRRWFSRSASKNSDQSASGGKSSLRSEPRGSPDDYDHQVADERWMNKKPLVTGTTAGQKNAGGGGSRPATPHRDTSEIKNPRKEAIVNSESMFQRTVSDPWLFAPGHSHAMDEASTAHAPVISTPQGAKSDKSRYPGPIGYLMPSRRNSHGSASLIRAPEVHKADTPGLFEQNVAAKTKGASYCFDYRPRVAAADSGGRWDSDTLLMSQKEVKKSVPDPLPVEVPVEAEKPGDGKEWFRVRVVDEDADSPWTRADWNVPEHLPGSPLCPLSPKNKSRGYGVCVYHGRRKTLGAGKSEW